MIAQIAALGQIQTRRIATKAKDPVNTWKKVTKPLAPDFERSSFLKEETSMQELASLHDLGFIRMTQEDLIESKAALNVIGYNPGNKLINLLTESAVLGVCRPGVDHHPHLNFLNGLLPRLKREAGASHLALALPQSLQKLLDVFTLTGEILANLSPVNLEDHGLKGENDFVALLKTARLAGYKLIAVQPNTPIKAFDPQYEQIMAANIQAILQSEMRAKVIFLAPDRHLGYTSVGDWLPVAGILQEQKVAICTVNQYWQGDFMPKVFACLWHGLKRPVALASKDVKMFTALQRRSLSLEHILPNNWDMTIIYPKKGSIINTFLRQRVVQGWGHLAQAFSQLKQNGKK